MKDSPEFSGIPTAGRGMIRLELLAAQSVEDGRGKFERLVTDIVMVIHPTAREIRPNPGDWGIDTFVGDLDGSIVSVWQSKFFLEQMGDSQKSQIRDSYASVVKEGKKQGFTIDSWTLCIPSTMTPELAQWWDSWKKKKAKEDSVSIQLWSDADIRGKLMQPDFVHVAEQYFGALPASRPTDRIVEETPDPTVYDEALFVRQLRAAHVRVDRPARTAFFNAEVMTRDINEREVKVELDELRSVKLTVEQKWANRFEGACARAETDSIELPGLFPDMCKAVEEYHSMAPSRVLRDTLVHRTGLLHHLVEEGRAGWTSNFESLAKEHFGVDNG
jgi:hypothetical protein